MPTHPEPAAPSYEGRRLPRPEEEVVDEGLAFDLGIFVSRRGGYTGTLAVGVDTGTVRR